MLDVIARADADVLSLVECDEYEQHWAPKLRELGYGSRWHKRPKEGAPDGCCLGFREDRWELIAHRGLSYHEHDRGAILGLLKRRGSGERVVAVSTHLARNPESSAQQRLRLRQVAELMRALGEFCRDHALDAAEVPCVVALAARETERRGGDGDCP